MNEEPSHAPWSLRYWPKDAAALREPAAPVEVDELTTTFAHRLGETMLTRNGIGLAAPQVGLNLALIAVAHQGAVLHLLNPTVGEVADEKLVDEGCLSIPNVFGEVIRWHRCTVTAQDLTGQRLELSATGRLAQVLQHEVDHLNGILMVDHLTTGQFTSLRNIVNEFDGMCPNPVMLFRHGGVRIG